MSMSDDETIPLPGGAYFRRRKHGSIWFSLFKKDGLSVPSSWYEHEAREFAADMNAAALSASAAVSPAVPEGLGEMAELSAKVQEIVSRTPLCIGPEGLFADDEVIAAAVVALIRKSQTARDEDDYSRRCSFDDPALDAARQIEAWYGNGTYPDTSRRITAVQILITNLMMQKIAPLAASPSRQEGPQSEQSEVEASIARNEQAHAETYQAWRNAYVPEAAAPSPHPSKTEPRQDGGREVEA